MKVLLVNGSPHKKGTTNRILNEIKTTLIAEGIEVKEFWVGSKPITGCIDCKKCATLNHCVFNDSVNEFLKISGHVDGFIFGTPVHYAAASGHIKSFMDRAMYANALGGGNRFRLKPAASVAVARRAGTIAAYDEMNKYFGISEMPIISSNYWNMAYGHNPQEVEQDEEGLRIMRVLARNMAYELKMRAAADAAGVPVPASESAIETNFIR